MSAPAELPPSVYQDLQKKSAEALTIKIESVNISTDDDPRSRTMAIVVQARVETVSRSASGLKAGDQIRIDYVHVEHKEPMAGPSEPDVLREGQIYPAFLVKAEKDGRYAIAAGGYSFRMAN